MQVAFLLAVALSAYSPATAGPAPGSRLTSSIADTTRGRIEGVITDSLNADLKDIEVTLEGLDIKLRKTTKSKKDGTFYFNQIPVGYTYQLTFRRIGFRPEKRTVALTTERAPTLAIVMVREIFRLPDVGVKAPRYGIIRGEIYPFGAREFNAGQIWLKDSAGKVNETKAVWDDRKFEFKHIPVGGPYTMTIKSLGFAKQEITGLMVLPGEELVINPLLAWTGSFLPEDTTRKKSDYKWLFATREDIKKHPMRTAAGVIYRFNLGEPRRPVGLECYSRTKVFINGQRADDAWPAVLEEFPAEDIDEIRYVTCWDESMPWAQRNAWYIKATPKPKKPKKSKKEKEKDKVSEVPKEDPKKRNLPLY